MTYGGAGALVNDANTSMAFNGTPSRITSSAPIGSSAYTLQAWVKVATAGLTGKGIVGDWASSAGALLYLNSSSAFGLVHNATYIQSSFVPAPGRWYLVSATWDGSTARIYVDGAPVAQGLASGAPGAGASSLEIGSYANGTSTTFMNGSLDEVAVWSQALTPSQIQNQWLAGRSVAQTSAETAYDNAWHPTQVDDQYLASGGFESGFADWDFGQGIGGGVCTTPGAACAIHTGHAAFSTGVTGNAQQDAVLVPGQSFRVQAYASRTSTAIDGIISVYYWKRSTGSWTTLVNSWADSSVGSWKPLAWDVTLPLDTDGRVRVALWTTHGTGSDSVFYDDAALYTSWANATYNANGTVDHNQVLRPGQAGAQAGSVVPTIDLASVYTADTGTSGTTPHPAIWPTTSIANYADGTYDPAKPDEDVASTKTYDAWGRTLAATDPDGVASTTHYTTDAAQASLNGYLTDTDWVKDGLGNPTTSTYDLAGNPLVVTDPNTHPTSRAYDLSSHVVSTTTADGVVSKSTFDQYGLKLAYTANWVDGNPSAGVDDVVTRYQYDPLGNVKQVDRDCATATGSCSGTGFADAVTKIKHDLLGNEVVTTAFPGAGGTGSARTTTSYFETTPGPGSTTVTRPKPGGTLGPVEPTAAAPMVPPTCPGTSSTLCTSADVMAGAGNSKVSGIDLDGQVVGVTDTYGKVARTFYDVAGRIVFKVQDYADGVFSTSAPDTDLVTTTVFDLAGQPIVATDPVGHTTVTTRDSLERATLATTKDTAAADVSVAKTVYTPGGRVDRASRPDATTGLSDAQRSWTKTLYDFAGRETKTLDHYDTTLAAGLAVDSFEGPSLTDKTIGNDGVAELWSGAAGTFISTGSAVTEDRADDAVRGTGTLKVDPAGATGRGVEWKLDGTFKQGRTYRANLWVKVPSGTTVRLRLGTSADATAAGSYDIAGNAQGGWQSLPSNATMSWTPTADRTGVVLAAYASTGTAVFRLDDAVVWDQATPDSDVPTSETVYDAAGQIVETVTPPGVPGTDEPMVTVTARDAVNRPTTVTVDAVAAGGTTDPALNLATTTAYDALGRVQAAVDPMGVVTSYGYDRLGNITQAVLNDVASPTDTSATSDQDVTSTFAYNALGELTGYCPAAAVWSTGSCDPKSSSDPNAWHYAFDDAGHLAVQTSPVNTIAQALASTRWEYDAGGRLAASCDTAAPASTCAGGGASVVRTQVPTYDGADRTTRLDTYAGAGTATLALRTETTFNGDGTPAQATYYEGATPTLKDTIAFAYDAAGRLTGLTRNGSTAIAGQTWNADGTLKTRTDGDAGAIGTTTFAYDWAKRLASATLPSAGFSGTVATWSWRADGLIGSRTYTSGGTASVFAYDAAKRVASLTRGTLTESQTYDRDGNVKSDARSFPGISDESGSGTQSFDYDALRRVVKSYNLSNAHSYSYTYDRDGNRATQTAGGVLFTYTYDRTDELVSVLKAGQTTQSFGYDSRGNLTGDAETGTAVTAYAYDLGNKLTGIDAAGTANDAAYAYDALGRIRTRTVGVSPSPVTTDTYSYASTLPAVVRIATGATNLDSVVTPSEERIAALSGSVNWFLPDLHGSISATLSSDQSTVTSATRYDAYGDTIATGTAGGTAVGATTWKYQGRLDISPAALGTPLYVMGARLYDPGIGAFTSLDTYSGKAQDPLSMNRFLYASANPATLVDPTGHWFGLDNLVAAVAGAVVGGAIAAVTDVASGQGIQLDHVVSGAVGGAVGAEVGLQTLNPVLAGAAGSAASNITQQAINIVGSGGKVGFDAGSLVKDTLVGAAMGAAGAAAGKVVSAVASKVSSFAGDLAGDFRARIPRLGELDDAAGDGPRVTPGDDLKAPSTTADPIDGTELRLRKMDGWSDDQVAQAQRKVDDLARLADDGRLVKTQVAADDRAFTSSFRRSTRQAGHDWDHIHDLQLGGKDVRTNLRLTDSSVNRSLGAQIAAQLRDLPYGTRITGVSWID